MLNEYEILRGGIMNCNYFRQHSRHSREGHRKTQPPRSTGQGRRGHNDSLATSRWRREPNPVALSELEGGNQDQNTHRENKYKPEFLDCSKLTPSVEEEAERGKSKDCRVFFRMCPLGK